jgi:hypothetical protein
MSFALPQCELSFAQPISIVIGNETGMGLGNEGGAVCYLGRCLKP